MADQKTDLQPVDVDFKNDKNCPKHNTLQYRVMRINQQSKKASLVVRRGASFLIDVTFNRDIVKGKDKMYLSFETRRFADLKAISDWKTKIRYHEVNKRRIQFEPMIPVNAYIGEYYPIISVKRDTDKFENSRHFTVENVVYVIFNPWNAEDPVYVANEEDRKNYLNADTGGYYARPDERLPAFTNFTFDQFYPDVIRVAFHLLGASKLDREQYSDPVEVLRSLGKRTNNMQNDVGLLQGKWSGINDYIYPWEWSSVAQIVDQYEKNGYRAAKYGQCFTFGCVFTSLCRALGIATRPIMISKSCNDWDDKGYMKYLYDENFQRSAKQAMIPGADAPRDSDWNYHILNEVWLRRDDLKKTFPQYVGPMWNAIDVTPQPMYDTFQYKTHEEAKTRDFVVGPMPRTAVRDRNDAVPYDVSLVRRYIMCGERGFRGRHCFYNYPDVGATYMWTGPKGAPVDIRKEYRTNDWHNKIPLARGAEIEETTPVLTNIKIESCEMDDPVVVGKTWKGKLSLVNKDKDKIAVEIFINSRIKDYIGQTLKQLTTVKKEQEIAGGEKKVVEWEYTPEDYDLPVMRTGSTIAVHVVVMGKKGVCLQENTVRIFCPPPTLQLLTKPPISAASEIEVAAVFTNPLQKPLNAVKFVIGSGANLKTIATPDSSLKPGQQAKVTSKVKVENHETMVISACVRSKEYNTETTTETIKHIENVSKEHMKVQMDQIAETETAAQEVVRATEKQSQTAETDVTAF